MSKKIGKILGILLSISIMVSGLCLMIQCVLIYNSGDKPYSRDAVAQAFGKISIPVLLCIGLIVLTFIYSFLVEDICFKQSAYKNTSFALKALTRKRDIADNADVRRERKLRKTHGVVLAVLLFAGFGCFFIYALNPANFHQSEINASMIKAIIVFCICIIIPFVYSIICVFINEKSRQRELMIMREIIKNAPVKLSDAKTAGNNSLVIIKTAALIICAGIILYGLLSGGTADVLTKAINICTECIGLG